MKYLQKILILLSLVGILITPLPIHADTNAGIVPGNPFYFIDITFEKISLFLTFNQERKIEKS